jgi:hypothetical protein
MRKPKVSFQDCGDCFLGEIEMPYAGGRVVASAVGFNPFETLSRAATIAERVASDPAMAALMPPQVLLAAKAARAISNTGRQNPDLLRAIAPDMTRSARTLAKALQSAKPKKRRGRRGGRSWLDRARGGARDDGGDQYDDGQYDGGNASQYEAQPAPQEYYQPAQTPGGFTPTPDDLRARELWGEHAFAPGSWGQQQTPQPQGFAEQFTEYEAAPAMPDDFGDDDGSYEE